MAEPTCLVDGCDKPATASRGMCWGHYERLRRYGDPLGRPVPRRVLTVCLIDGCDRDPKQAGMCYAHYERKRKHGDPLGGRPSGLPPEVRFWSKVDARDGCWVWTGAIGSHGYGTFWDRRYARAHRWAYEQMIGEIPAGLVLDHLCRNRACVNPYHLEPVTPAINTARARMAATA